MTRSTTGTSLGAFALRKLGMSCPGGGRGLKAGVVALAFIVSVASSALGQERIEIADNQRCTACEIRLERVASLGSIDDPDSPDQMMGRILRSSTGRYYVGPATARHQILVYDRNGSFERAIGRAGDGPGEFRDIVLIALGPGDTLHIFDRSTARLTLLDPIELTPVRYERVEADVEDAVRLINGDLIIHANIRTRERAGFPLHRISPTGAGIHSFGARDLTIERETSERAQYVRFARRISSVGEDKLVVAQRFDRYELELWDSEGRHLSTLVRVGWPFANFQINGLSLDEEGLIWASIAVPNAHYTPPAANVIPGVERDLPPRSSASDWNDTVIEVIDPMSARVVATLHRPEAFHGFRSGQFLAHFREDASRMEIIDVWRARLNVNSSSPEARSRSW